MRASVLVGFRDHQVRVSADEAWVIDWIAEGFSQLRATRRPASEDELELRPIEGGFCVVRGGVTTHVRDTIEDAARELRHEIIDAFIARYPDLLWIHAGAAVCDLGAVLFVGRYGRGKSTLVTRLCARGWKYISDDIVPLDVETSRILPFPLTPIVRENVGWELPRERVAELGKSKVSLPAAAFHSDPVPVGGVVLPRYRSGTPASLDPHSPGLVTLDLLREAINKERDRASTVALCVRMVNDVPVLPIGFSSADAAVDLVEHHFGQVVAPRRCG